MLQLVSAVDQGASEAVDYEQHQPLTVVEFSKTGTCRGNQQHRAQNLAHNHSAPRC